MGTLFLLLLSIPLLGQPDKNYAVLYPDSNPELFFKSADGCRIIDVNHISDSLLSFALYMAVQEQRIMQSLPPYKRKKGLERAAKWFGRELHLRHFFSHVHPTNNKYKTMADRKVQFGIRDSFYIENLERNCIKDGQTYGNWGRAVVSDLMKAVKFRVDLTNPKCKYIGCGANLGEKISSGCTETISVVNFSGELTYHEDYFFSLFPETQPDSFFNSPFAKLEIGFDAPDIILMNIAAFMATQEQRIKNGKHPLKRNKLLEKAAYGHSRAMCDYHFFDHKNYGNESQRSPEKRCTNVGYYNSVSENIALVRYSSSSTYGGWARYVLNTLLSSPPHKKNMLSDHAEMGCGAAIQDFYINRGSFKTTKTTQNFGGNW